MDALSPPPNDLLHETTSAPGGASLSLSRGLFTQVARALRENVGVDLGNCRHDLVLRAIGRRLRARRQESLKAYSLLIGEDPVEPRRLARALLPSDGDLFLDVDSCSVLSLRLATSITQHEPPRVWVVECGEGEEVYALALRIHHLLAALEGAIDFTVYGTEIDAGALQLAYSGLLAPSFAEQIPAALAEGFVQPLAHGAQVLPSLSRYCRFSEQLLLAPPPVPMLDVVSGRNILRFLSTAEQRQLLTHWYRALKPGGLLLLGPGESPQGHEDLFAARPLAPGMFLRQSQSEAVHIGSASQRSAEQVDIEVYRAAFVSSARASGILDSEGRLLDANAAFLTLFGDASRSLIGKPFGDCCAPEDREAIYTLVQHPLPSMPEGQPDMREVRLIVATGTLSARVHVYRHEGQNIRCHVELELLPGPAATPAPEAGAIEAALELINEGVVFIDAAQRIQMLNATAGRLTGWTPEEARGRLANDVLRLAVLSGEPLTGLIEDCLVFGAPISLPGQQTQLLSRDGRRVAVDVRMRAMTSPGVGPGVALVIEDVSQRLLLSEELAWRSSHDLVTGLLNRDAFELRLRAALNQIRQSGGSAVVCMVDIDQFRLVNDVLGHAAGDEMLHELAGELRVRLREGDVVARLSGDEFGVLLPACTLADGEAMVEALLNAARRYRFQWLGQQRTVTLSIGVAQIDNQTENVGRALSLADAACHAAKQAGRDRARFMGRDDEARLHHREMGLVGQVGRAIEDGRLFLYCEDVVSVRSPSQVMYRELLVRMRGEDGSLIQPSNFVPAAERYFLMSALDRWVVRHALRSLARMPVREKEAEILYAINISGQSIGDPEFLDFVLEQISETGVAPQRLCFEITETTAISRLSEATRFVAHLTAHGCKFALDDFGVGMSSFSYLKNFPVHFLKIDGSFVRSMRDSQIDRGVVETINRIGHQLGLKTIAEHVESVELLDSLRNMGVDWAQGHGITSGQPLDDLLQ